MPTYIILLVGWAVMAFAWWVQWRAAREWRDTAETWERATEKWKRLAQMRKGD